MTVATRVIAVDPLAPDRSILDEAGAILRRGGLVAFGTETVYGLGADATNADAIARIFEAKGRPAINPLIVHAADIEQAQGCTSGWPTSAGCLADRFWPGPLTLILPRSKWVPDLVTAGRETVGVRVPDSLAARGLIRAADRPLAAPSANRSTGISPTHAAHVLGDLDGKIELILDSGPCLGGLESTVLDLSGTSPRLLRPGLISADVLSDALGLRILSPLPIPAEDEAFTSPGQMTIHYSPRTASYRIEANRLSGFRWPERAGLLVIGSWSIDETPALAFHIRLATPSQASRELYARLHELDHSGLECIVIVPPPEGPEWDAVRDRVRRATRPYP